MNRRVLFVVVLLGVVIGGLLTFSGAFGRNVDSGPYPEIPSTGVLADVTHTAPDPETLEDYTTEITEKLNAWQGDLFSTTKWLHLVSRHNRTKDQVSTLSTGQTIPEDYIMETWNLLNNEGLVVETVTFMKDLDGNIVQTSVFKNNIWYNLTINEKWEGEPFEIKLDFGFRNKMSGEYEVSVSVNKTSREENGTVYDVYSIEDVYDYPVTMSGYDYQIVSGGGSIVFDQADSSFVKTEQYLKDENGEFHIIEIAEYLSIELVESPPQEILDLLKE